MENDKEEKHHHTHHHRKLTIPSKISVKYYDYNNEKSNFTKISKNNDKKEYKHHNHRNASGIKINNEKDYFKYKLDNFGKEKQSLMSKEEKIKNKRKEKEKYNNYINSQDLKNKTISKNWENYINEKKLKKHHNETTNHNNKEQIIEISKIKHKSKNVYKDIDDDEDLSPNENYKKSHNKHSSIDKLMNTYSKNRGDYENSKKRDKLLKSDKKELFHQSLVMNNKEKFYELDDSNNNMNSEFEENQIKDNKNNKDIKQQKNKNPKINQEKLIQKYFTKLTSMIDIEKIWGGIPGGPSTVEEMLTSLEFDCTDEKFDYVYNKKNFYKSKNAKELCRNGISLKYLKTFFTKLLNLENCEENYNIKYSMKIKQIEPEYLGDYVPYFCGKNKTKLQEALPVHYLNNVGILNLKIIMWLISDLAPRIEYSPILIKLCSIFLIFLEAEETYEAMRTLIDMNYRPNEINKLKWHFRFTYKDYENLGISIKTYLESESDNMRNFFGFLEKKGIDPIIVIRDFCDNLFLNHLNFIGIIRFICIYIYDGSKAIYRFIYGLLNYVYEEKFEELKSSKNDIYKKIKKIIFNITDYKKIIKDCFNIQINPTNVGIFDEKNSVQKKNDEKNKNSDDENENIEKSEGDSEANDYMFEFYLPSIEPKSNILTSDEIVKLWSKMPTEMKNSNLATIYSVSRKKVNMKSILELSKKYDKEYSIMILIETEQNEKFGAILPSMLEETEENEYIPMNKCILVQFRPKIALYIDKNEKGNNMLCCNKRGLWFCKQEVGVLFSVDGTLTEGNTCNENTYFGQVYLTRKGNFLIKDFEIIVFIKDLFY